MGKSLKEHPVIKAAAKTINTPFSILIDFSKKIILPGFDGLPLYDVLAFFFKGIIYGSSITARASAIAFNFFLAIFPSIIFFFTIIPFIPVHNFQDVLLDLIREFTPQETFEMIKTTLFDIVKRPRGGLLSVGFIMTLYFSTNGISSVIDAFNETYHSIETRSWIKQRLISLMLVIIIAVIVIVAIILIIFGTTTLNFLLAQGILKSKLAYNLIQAGKWIVILAMFFFTVSFIYYFGPSKKHAFVSFPPDPPLQQFYRYWHPLDLTFMLVISHPIIPYTVPLELY
jgi:membrane protein